MDDASIIIIIVAVFGGSALIYGILRHGAKVDREQREKGTPVVQVSGSSIVMLIVFAACVKAIFNSVDWHGWLPWFISMGILFGGWRLLKTAIKMKHEEELTIDSNTVVDAVEKTAPTAIPDKEEGSAAGVNKHPPRFAMLQHKGVIVALIIIFTVTILVALGLLINLGGPESLERSIAGKWRRGTECSSFQSGTVAFYTTGRVYASYQVLDGERMRYRRGDLDFIVTVQFPDSNTMVWYKEQSGKLKRWLSFQRISNFGAVLNETENGSQLNTVFPPASDAYPKSEGIVSQPQSLPTSPAETNQQIHTPSPTYTPLPATSSASTIVESHIEGEFNGWDGETIFKLDNGQIWQQSLYAYYYHYAYRPEVTIYLTGGRYKMQVEGIDEKIDVVRLR